MKTILRVINILALLHFCAILAAVGYLGLTDRLSSQRLKSVTALFGTTVSAEKAAADAASASAAVDSAKAAQLAALDEPSDGADSRTSAILKSRDLIAESRQRAEADLAALRTRLENDIAALAAQRKAFEADQEAALQERKRIDALTSDAQFQKVLGTFKALPAQNQKNLVDEYLRTGRDTFVLDLLDNLDKRTSQALFALYDAQPDLSTAADLLTRLRVRGLTAGSADPGPAPASSTAAADSDSSN